MKGEVKLLLLLVKKGKATATCPKKVHVYPLLEYLWIILCSISTRTFTVTSLESLSDLSDLILECQKVIECPGRSLPRQEPSFLDTLCFSS